MGSSIEAQRWSNSPLVIITWSMCTELLANILVMDALVTRSTQTSQSEKDCYVLLYNQLEVHEVTLV